MPLHKGTSQKTFEKNFKTEMEHGKPKAQSLAIAYAMKRKAQHAKMAKGGEIDPQGAYVEREEPSMTDKLLGMKGNIKSLEAYEDPEKAEAIKMAEGGFIGSHQSTCTEDCNNPAHINEKASGYHSMPENDVKHNEMAMKEDDRMLNQHGEYEVGPGGYAEGGFIGSHQSKEHEMDMVGRIMKQRQQMYSKGGQVANDVHQFRSDFETDNNFDDLVERDDLNFNYTGANSGDEVDNARENKDRHDIVSRIMSSRRKKDKFPTGYWSEIVNDPRLKRS